MCVITDFPLNDRLHTPCALVSPFSFAEQLQSVSELTSVSPHLCVSAESLCWQIKTGLHHVFDTFPNLQSNHVTPKFKDKNKKKPVPGQVQDTPIRTTLGSVHVPLQSLVKRGQKVEELCDFGALHKES